MAKALTLLRPWPYAFCRLGKGGENRGVRYKHTGPLWLHASKQLADGEWSHMRSLMTQEEIEAYYADPDYLTSGPHTPGAIVAYCEVIGCVAYDPCLHVPDRHCTGRHLGTSLYSFTYKGGIYTASPDRWWFGPYVMVVPKELLIPLPRPVPCRGKQGLWNVPPEVERECLAQLEEMKVTEATAPPETPEATQEAPPTPEQGEESGASIGTDAEEQAAEQASPPDAEGGEVLSTPEAPVEVVEDLPEVAAIRGELRLVVDQVNKAQAEFDEADQERKDAKKYLEACQLKEHMLCERIAQAEAQGPELPFGGGQKPEPGGALEEKLFQARELFYGDPDTAQMVIAVAEILYGDDSEESQAQAHQVIDGLVTEGFITRDKGKDEEMSVYSLNPLAPCSQCKKKPEDKDDAANEFCNCEGCRARLCADCVKQDDEGMQLCQGCYDSCAEPAPDGETPAAELPEEDYQAAIRYTRKGKRKKKGFTAVGLAMSLFGSKDGPFVEKSRQIIARLVAESYATEAEKVDGKEPAFWPADPEDATEAAG